MKAKNKINLTFDPILILIFIFITVSVFLINRFMPDLNLNTFFTSPTSQKGAFPFNFHEPASWCRMVLYIFGTKQLFSWILLGLLGLLISDQETNYGTFLLLVMMLLSTIFSGVLAACFSTETLTGPYPLIFLLLILKIMNEFKKKTVSLFSIAVAVLYIVYILFSEEKIESSIIPLFIVFAGGLCGSLISLLTIKKSFSKKEGGRKSPKKTVTTSDSKNTSKTVVYFDNEADSPRFKNKKKNDSDEDDDMTVIGTLEL